MYVVIATNPENITEVREVAESHDRIVGVLAGVPPRYQAATSALALPFIACEHVDGQFLADTLPSSEVDAWIEEWLSEREAENAIKIAALNAAVPPQPADLSAFGAAARELYTTGDGLTIFDLKTDVYGRRWYVTHASRPNALSVCGVIDVPTSIPMTVNGAPNLVGLVGTCIMAVEHPTAGFRVRLANGTLAWTDWLAVPPPVDPGSAQEASLVNSVMDSVTATDVAAVVQALIAARNGG